MATLHTSEKAHHPLLPQSTDLGPESEDNPRGTGGRSHHIRKENPMPTRKHRCPVFDPTVLLPALADGASAHCAVR